jgi:hypothetical protein
MRSRVPRSLAFGDRGGTHTGLLYWCRYGLVDYDSSGGPGSGYTTLNQLMGATATWPDGTSESFCWQYDPFGN